MSAKSLHRLRSRILIGGVFGAIIGAIVVGAWEIQAGQRIDIPILEGGETDGVKAEPIPTPLAAGVTTAAMAISVWLVLRCIPGKCPACGAFAVYARHETRRLSLYRCGKCNEVDPDAPAVRSPRRRSPSSGF